jgi:type I restriction-modification system DNA methylase subunit
MLQEIRHLIEKLDNSDNKRTAQNISLELANQILLFLGAPESNLKSINDALESAFPYSYFRNQKMETWFETHRFYDDARIALKLYDDKDSSFESSFYHLNESATKARIAATTLLGTNWEDSELTELPQYKVGIDFYLNHESKALLMVISKRGNIRALEFSERLTNTQVEILNHLKGVLVYNGLDPETGKLIPREPQKTIHQMLWKALQLNEVNKKFYQGISDHFQILVSHLKKQHSTFDKKDLQLFSSRLIGRLLFIWFLKKMNLINQEMKYFDLEDTNASQYYKKKIKPLFFETLNQPIKNRKHQDLKTPFLNGGLFELHDNDFYDVDLKFPDNFFETLYEHLNSFNFTVDESTPEYEQIAIDPEMLGRVFENLLASIVPETANAANERKNKGAFYTPREIVSYMCKESLKEFMKTKLNDESLELGVDKLIDLNDAKFLELKSTGLADLWGVRSKDIVPKLIDVLNDIKVFDPACGSGAFPMGMLQIISRTYDRLTAKYDIDKKRHIYASGKSTYNKYESKLNIIRNNLYGSDIEPMAIEIARLRSWLSLIIEEKEQSHPLPNLDFNFVCSNTLIKLEEDSNLFGVNFEGEYEKLREKYYNAHSKEEKLKLRKDFENLYKNYCDDSFSSKRVQQLKSWDPFNISKPSDFFDAKKMFNVKNFDIVIANPPYIHLESIKELSKKLYKPLGYKSYEARGDIYSLFYEFGIERLSSEGILCYITSNKWMRAGYGESLRNYFIDHTQPLTVIDLGSGVFDSATVDTNIVLLKKSKYIHDTKALALSKDSNVDFSEQFNKKHVNIKFQKNQPWVILTDIEQNIKQKIEKYGKPIRQIPEIKINYGIKTGFNEAFIINETTKNKILNDCKSKEEVTRTLHIIKPLLRGKDIKSGKHSWKKLYLINMHNGYKSNSKYVKRVDVNNYPAIKMHLDNYLEELSKRTDQGDTPYNLRNCAYIEDFDKLKICYSETNSSSETKIFLDTENYITDKTTFILTAKDDDTLRKIYTIMSSKIFTWYMSKISPLLGDSGISLTKDTIGLFPIATNLDDDNPYNLSDEEKAIIMNTLS